MREYNFDENKNMGETVRIDKIKMKLNEIEDFDDDIEDVDSSEEEEDAHSHEYDAVDDSYGETTEIPVINKPQKAASHSGKKNNKHAKNSDMNKNKVLLILSVAILAVVVVVAAVALANRASKINEDAAAENAECRYFYGVIVSVNENKLEVIDTEDGKTSMYSVGPDITVLLEDGKTASASYVSRGDIAYFGVSKENDELVNIEYSNTVWEKTGFKNVQIDEEHLTISNGTVKYTYGDNSIFIYNGDFITAKDLCSEDVVTLRGIKDTVWSVTVEKYHGYIKLENVDKIEDAVITIDGKKIEFEDNKAAVSAGTHALGISGSNIDTLNVDIHITAGEIYSVDMASVQEKTGVLTLGVNVEDCIIIVDGKQVQKDTPVVLSMGTYTVSVSAEGYKTYNGTVEITEPLVQLDIELEKIVPQKASMTFDSNPREATVYAGDFVIGVTPFTAQLEYGDYRITFKKEGYSDYTVATTVDEEQKSISVLLTEE